MASGQAIRQETVLVALTDDLHPNVDGGHPSLLLLLDSTAVFETVDLTILLKHLEAKVGITTTFEWFKLFLMTSLKWLLLDTSGKCGFCPLWFCRVQSYTPCYLIFM